MPPSKQPQVKLEGNGGMAHSESFSTTDPTNLTGGELDCLKEAFALFDAGKYYISRSNCVDLIIYNTRFLLPGNTYTKNSYGDLTPIVT